ncbi:MAG: Rpn family recombination-promoting nuclease/putative transposase [Anaerolineaceae bacterium]|nr:Rpn family recombination-promoting nuclease/putative transposase [Anaerolineaceae bacterium]
MKKTLDELTLMDDYMFAAVMRNKDILKRLLQCILNINISRIEFLEAQKTEKTSYESKGVRLDLYVVDENGIIYNVEIQTSDKRNLPKRMRYYQSAIDISVLNPGDDYNKLRNSYIIFICNYDPFEQNRYIYTFENTCREDPELKFGDEAYKIVVNTKGCKGEISEELKEVIMYLDLEKVTGGFSRELDDAVKSVKDNEANRLEYLRHYIRDNEIKAEGREEGREEGRKEGEITQTIKLYRSLLNADDDQIRNVIMKDFNLSVDEANAYLIQPVTA